MNRYFLIGYMGSGKTTFGRYLAKALGFSFVDLDTYIESKEQKSVQTIFSEQGEDRFRRLEQEALQNVAHYENCIISTGGGTPCFFDNMEFMNRMGETVYLRAKAQTLAGRLRFSRSKRPLLRGKSEEELEQFIEGMLKNREPFYLRCSRVIDTDGQSMDDIVSLFRKECML